MDYPFSIGDMLPASDMHPTSSKFACNRAHTAKAELYSSNCAMER